MQWTVRTGSFIVKRANLDHDDHDHDHDDHGEFVCEGQGLCKGLLFQAEKPSTITRPIQTMTPMTPMKSMPESMESEVDPDWQ